MAEKTNPIVLEQQRIGGDVGAVIGQLREELSTVDWKNAPSKDLPDLMRKSRLLIVSLGSAYNHEPNGRRAYQLLHESAQRAKEIYLHPRVVSEAKSMKVDSEGNEYLMLVEMLRDMGSHQLKVYGLVREKRFLQQSALFWNQALNHTGDRTRVRHLCALESMAANRRVGSRFPLGDADNRLDKIVASDVDGDRKAAAGFLYMREAMIAGSLAGVRKGVDVIVRHSEQPVTYVAKRLVGEPLRRMQRMATYWGTGDELYLSLLPLR